MKNKVYKLLLPMLLVTSFGAGLTANFVMMRKFLEQISNDQLIDRAQKLFDLYPLMIKDKNHIDWDRYYRDIIITYREISDRYNDYAKPWNWGNSMRKAYLQVKEIYDEETRKIYGNYDEILKKIKRIENEEDRKNVEVEFRRNLDYETLFNLERRIFLKASSPYEKSMLTF
jgi:hypothetical protein